MPTDPYAAASDPDATTEAPNVEVPAWAPDQPAQEIPESTVDTPEVPEEPQPPADNEYLPPVQEEEKGDIQETLDHYEEAAHDFVSRGEYCNLLCRPSVRGKCVPRNRFRIKNTVRKPRGDVCRDCRAGILVGKVKVFVH